MPGEKTSKTQPFPTKPPAYERQGVTEADLIDFTPQLRQEALDVFRQYESGPLYTPPCLVGEIDKRRWLSGAASWFRPPLLRGTINLPGWVGGSNWQGAAFDPDSGLLYLTSVTSPIEVGLIKTEAGDKTGFDYLRTLKGALNGPRGLPLVKPPYGRLTAINLNEGTQAWQQPLGTGPLNHPALKGVKGLPKQLGAARRGHVLATRTLLFVGQEGNVGKIISLIRDNRGLEALATKMTVGAKAVRLRQEDGYIAGGDRAARQRDRGADDVRGRRQTIHRLSRRRAVQPRRVDRPESAGLTKV